MGERVFNFAAGPAVLPEEVLERAQKEMLNWNGSGMSVMEMTHRSAMFQGIFDHARDGIRELLCIPDNYAVLFLQGGASTQFSMVPLNLMGKDGKADYAVTGHFSKSAAAEAAKYGTVRISCDTGQTGYDHIPADHELEKDPGASYFHYCKNNTIFGTEWDYIPECGNVPLVCDMSSDFLSVLFDVSRYGLVYAGAQKNLAPAGVTVVIIRRDLAGREADITPLMMSYQRMIDKDSMYNTPPCWNIYMLGLMTDWIRDHGGAEGMSKRRDRKSGMLYELLDSSSLYKTRVRKDSRSKMNVTFRTDDPELDARFVREAAAEGLVNLKGHRLSGGMRASLYNAMEEEGVVRLCEFMKDFERRMLSHV